VVIDNFDLGRTFPRPDKAQPELVIDADAVLAAPVPMQRFQSVRWRQTQIPQISCHIEHGQLSQRGSFNVVPSLHAMTFKQCLRTFAGK